MRERIRGQLKDEDKIAELLYFLADDGHRVLRSLDNETLDYAALMSLTFFVNALNEIAAETT